VPYQNTRDVITYFEIITPYELIIFVMLAVWCVISLGDALVSLLVKITLNDVLGSSFYIV